MKSYLSILAALTVLFSFSSCDKVEGETSGGEEEAPVEKTEVTVSIIAAGDFHMNEWESGDAVVINGVISEPLKQSEDTKVTFTVNADVSTPYSVLYPVKAYAGEGKISLPADQSYTVHSAYGKILYMRPVTGVLKVPVQGDRLDMLFDDPIVKVEVKGNDGEQLWGNIGYDYAKSRFVQKGDAAGNNSLSMDAKGSEIGFHLPAGTYAKGLTLTFTDESGDVMNMVADEPVEIVSGKNTDAARLLPELSVELVSKQEVIRVRSDAMKKDVPVTVITPDCYALADALPVVYLLHGYSDSHLKWGVDGHIAGLADKYDFIVVMPDGGFSSWYFDSPIDPTYKYETFVSKELVSYIDKNYRTVASRTARFITGNSMGGHGAMYLAIRHQDIFGNAGATSGGVDFRPFPDKWDIKKRLGSITEYPQNWEDNTVINMTGLIKPGLNIIFDCGTEDFFYTVNCNLHDKLDAAGIPHEFRTSPGSHNWTYWFNNIGHQFRFFDENKKL